MPEQDIRSPHTDDLSPLAREILALNLNNSYNRLVVHGGGNPEAKKLLKSATSTELLSAPIRSQGDADALLAGLWLWHDWLDESHQISQGLHSATGSFWHAIMHRREGDFSNSQYWYARCQNHPVLASLAQHAGQVLHPLPADKQLLRLINPSWNPNAFVDLVAAVQSNPNDPKHAAAISLQQLEWRLLFDHCTRSAAGK